MDITQRALKRIKQLKDRQGVSRTTGLRLGLKDGSVYLKWDHLGPRGEDFVDMRHGFPMYINAQAYPRIADYVLDYEHDHGSARFLLRPRPKLAKEKSKWETGDKTI